MKYNTLHVTDHTAVNTDVQIPANAFYTPVGLATGVTTLPSPFNTLYTQNATPQFFIFIDRTSATIFTILNTSTCLISLGFSAVQNWASAVTPGCTLVSPK